MASDDEVSLFVMRYGNEVELDDMLSVGKSLPLAFHLIDDTQGVPLRIVADGQTVLDEDEINRRWHDYARTA